MTRRRRRIPWGIITGFVILALSLFYIPFDAYHWRNVAQLACWCVILPVTIFYLRRDIRHRKQEKGR